jgi:hypothetical protein
MGNSFSSAAGLAKAPTFIRALHAHFAFHWMWFGKNPQAVA